MLIHLPAFLPSLPSFFHFFNSPFYYFLPPLLPLSAVCTPARSEGPLLLMAGEE